MGHPLEAKLFYFDQIIFTIAHAKFNSMFQTGFQLVSGWVSVKWSHDNVLFCKDAAADHWLTVYCICASLIQSNRSKEANIPHLVRSEYHFTWQSQYGETSITKTDVEIRFIFDDCIGVFSDLAVENIICFAGSTASSLDMHQCSGCSQRICCGQ